MSSEKFYTDYFVKSCGEIVEVDSIERIFLRDVKGDMGVRYLCKIKSPNTKMTGEYLLPKRRLFDSRESAEEAGKKQIYKRINYHISKLERLNDILKKIEVREDD